MRQTHNRCNHPEHEGKRYLPVDMFHKRGLHDYGPHKGQQRYDNHCKVCRNRDLRRRYAEGNPTRTKQWDNKKAYLRARSRALTRLTHLVPELYEQVLKEECAKENVRVREDNANWRHSRRAG